MTIRVDGVELDPGPVDPETPLIRVLQKKLHIEGLRKRCMNSSCGGCEILLDGQPVKACSVAWKDAEGRDVQTLGGDSGQSVG